MSKITVLLGRAGDIISFLPLLHADFQKTGERQRLMIAAECSPLLEGASYVDSVVYPGPHYELSKAVSLARTMSDEVLSVQIKGPPLEVRDCTYLPSGSDQARATSFEKEQWRVAGRLSEWDDNLPLVFDLRDNGREVALGRKAGLIKKGWKKPVILLALNSISSPFPYADLLRELIKGKFAESHQIVELPQAERIYDLLGLYERADLLIAADSAPLHLAWACPKLPVFAITQDHPMLWHGSPWRRNHAWYCRYRDWPERAVEMLHAIENLKWEDFRSRKYVMAWNAYNDRTKYPVNRNILPVRIGYCGRDSTVMLQDKKPAPYLKDVLRMAMQRAETDNIDVILTRAGVAIQKLSPSPSFAYRLFRDGDGLHYQPTVDMFCAPRKLWREMLPEIPDLVLNLDPYWGQCLWTLFKQRGATDATGSCVFQEGK